MSFLKLVINGVGGTPLALPVKVVSGLPLVMDGLETETLELEITNPLSTQLVLNEIKLVKAGAAASKVNASLRFDTLTIAPFSTAQNFIDVESVELLYEGESFSLTMEWSNA